MIGTTTVLSAKLPPAADRQIDFIADVQPLFAKFCHDCHGAEQQESALRLDVRSAAMRGGAGGQAIVPGRAAESRLLRLVAGLEEDLKMPPEGDPLTAEQVGILRAWIEQGANWPDEVAGREEDNPAWWAFRPPVRPEPPVCANAEWPRGDLDRFVLAKLEAAGLVPSPQADRRTLIRRLSFDLCGLPPTPEETAEFIADERADAYEQLVERLLTSPRYGERWGRHWLDVVRFAESHGFEMNQPRPNAWPFRDWVIAAFNNDLPYTDFVTAQLAGDALEQPGHDAATAFLVAGAWDQVKSPDPVLTAQQRADELHDMTSTTGSVFLGLTVGCARCHHHKFDPISQQDYYALQAVLAGVEHGERPLRQTNSANREVQLAEVERRLGETQQELTAYEPLARPTGIVLLDDERESPSVTVLLEPAGHGVNPAGAARGQRDDPGSEERTGNASLGRYTWWQNEPGRDFMAYRPGVVGRHRLWLSWGCGYATHTIDAQYVLDLDGDRATLQDQQTIATVDQQQPAGGSGPLFQQPRWSGFFAAGQHELRAESVILVRGGKTGTAVTADVIALEAPDQADGTEQLPKLALRGPVQARQNMERFSPLRATAVRLTILATKDGSEPCLDELEVFIAAIDGQPARNVALASAGAKATASGTLPGFEIHKLEHLHDGQYGNGRSWIASTAATGWVQIELAEPTMIDRVAWGRDREQKFLDRLATQYVVEVADENGVWRVVAGSADRVPFVEGRPDNAAWRLAGLSSEERANAQRIVDEAASLEQQRKSLVSGPMVYAGKLTQPGPTHRLHRGDPMQPREQVAPGGIASLGTAWQLPADAKEQDRRLALARWIASPDNPLTARVLVNRVWHYHFGQGLVATPSDLGANGGRPTHPELLDWLATEFMARGWRIKDLHRWIVLSATYRQSSIPRPNCLAVDAGTQLLWRYAPRRMEAEPIRDAILTATGKLNLTQGGPGYDVFEPNNNYVRVFTPKEEFGPAEWRRMVYQNKPRMEQDEIFGTFDCPDAGQPTPRRNSSTTPLQALNLLNSRFMLQQAELFAERLTLEAGETPGSRVRRAFQLAFQREPDADELAASAALIREHGLAVFCRAILNANEFVYVD